MGSLQVNSAQKVELLENQLNFDLSKIPLQIIQELNLQRPEQHEKFLQTVQLIVPRLLFSFQFNFLSNNSSCEKEEFGCLLLQALNQLRPQLLPEFAYNFMALLSESTLLQKLQLNFCSKNINEKGEQNLVQSRNVLSVFKNKIWELYAFLLKQTLQFVGPYCKQPQQFVQTNFVLIYQALVRLLCLLRTQCPVFLNHYRIYLQDAIPQFANYLRNLTLPLAPQYLRTDDPAGLLSLPQTDVSEYFFIENLFTFQLEEFTQEHFQTLMKQLREVQAQPQQLQAFLNAFAFHIVHQLYRQNKKQTFEATPALIFMSKFLQEVQTDLMYSVLTYISAHLGNPSQETYAAAALMVHFYKNGQPATKDVVKRVIQERLVKEPSYAAGVVWLSIRKRK